MTFLGDEHIPSLTRQNGVPNVVLKVGKLGIFQSLCPGIHPVPKSSLLWMGTQCIGAPKLMGALGGWVFASGVTRGT